MLEVQGIIVVQPLAVRWTRITSIVPVQIIIHSEDVAQNITVFGQLAKIIGVNPNIMIRRTILL
jgi:hypothetical protein